MMVLDNFIQEVTEEETGELIDIAPENRALSAHMGYFAIVCKLRVQVALVDYHGALATASKIGSTHFKLFAGTAASYSTFFYFCGFAFLMSRRLADAIYAFSHALLFLARTKNAQLCRKQYDQMMALLAICVSLSPLSLDATISTLLSDHSKEYF